jgi:energy-coupling factor transporter ATP-binding protein EcfA2
VSLSELRPDAKDQYKVIKRVTFEGSTDFPEEVVFNPNLNAIIGSRSSGKSALLAHIAHAIDPDYTVAQQVLATRLKESEVGPAAGRSWKSVEATTCTVEWADGATNTGQVIYIPQNWLYQISDNPKEVTEKIRPVLESQYPTFFREHQRILDAAKTANDAVDREVLRWFELVDEVARLDADIKQVGEKTSITNAREDIKVQIETLRAANSLSAVDLENYQAVVADLGAKRARIEEIGLDSERLAELVTESQPRQFTSIPGAVAVEIEVSPDPNHLSESLASTIESLVSASEATLVRQVEAAIVAHRTVVAKEVETLNEEIVRLERDNRDLLEKHKANATLDELVKRQKAQQDSLDRIDNLEARRKSVIEDQDEAVAQVAKQIASRTASLESLSTSFAKEKRSLDQLTFGIAVDFDPIVVRALSEPFRKSETGTFLMKAGGAADSIVDVRKAQDSPEQFLQDLFTKRQKLNQGNSPSDVARRVLTAAPEVRFTATLDEDKIGGFDRSTMTPGKQALFALTLILGEAEERWTLLIDQPEDDLDSRSIYGDIVRYIVEQKKQRQIILVTHNANLVVGSDAEEVLVANRHGDDRKNKDDRTFDYLTGSLEYSGLHKASIYELDRMGIREHAVEILDGGEEAFLKRRDKYKI